MVDVMAMFKVLLIVQLFYGFGITLSTYTLPSDSLIHVTAFNDIGGETYDMQSIKTQVEEAVEQQTSIPVVELGALVFYSGNILVDLILNFMFAVPSMINLLIGGLMFLISIPTDIMLNVQIFSGVLISVLYFIGVLQLLIGIRSGRVV